MTRNDDQEAGRERWHDALREDGSNMCIPCCCTDGDHHPDEWITSIALNAEVARRRDPTPQAVAGDGERCLHETTSVLTEVGEYGNEVITDWVWCVDCGAVRRRPSHVWSSPAAALARPAPSSELVEAKALMAEQHAKMLEMTGYSLSNWDRAWLRKWKALLARPAPSRRRAMPDFKSFAGRPEVMEALKRMKAQEELADTPTPAALAGGEWRVQEPDNGVWYVAGPANMAGFRAYSRQSAEIAVARLNALTADLAAARARIEELEAALTEEKHLHEVNLNRAGAWAAKAGLYSAEAEQLRAALREIVDADLLKMFPIIVRSPEASRSLTPEENEDNRRHTMAQQNSRFGFKQAQRIAYRALTGQQEQGG